MSRVLRSAVVQLSARSPFLLGTRALRRVIESRTAARITFGHVVSDARPRPVTVAVRRPAALELRLDFVELTSGKVRVVAGDLTQVVRAAYVIVRAIGRTIGLRVEVRSEVCFILVCERACRLGNGTPRPPPADRARDSADQSTKRPSRRADSGADEHAGNAARRLGQLIHFAGVTIVRAKCGIFRTLDATVD